MVVLESSGQQPLPVPHDGRVDMVLPEQSTITYDTSSGSQIWLITTVHNKTLLEPSSRRDGTRRFCFVLVTVGREGVCLGLLSTLGLLSRPYSKCYPTSKFLKVVLRDWPTNNWLDNMAVWARASRRHLTLQKMSEPREKKHISI